jgi:hypothetical protein
LHLEFGIHPYNLLPYFEGRVGCLVILLF